MMIEQHSSTQLERPRVRRVPLRPKEDSAQVAAVQEFVVASIKETLDWNDKLDVSALKQQFDRKSIQARLSSVRELFGTPVQRTLKLDLRPGTQFIVPPYDLGWDTLYGDNFATAHHEGKIVVLPVGNGFVASGFGFYLEADEEGLVSIYPQGECDSNWFSLENSPGLHSRAGAGVVVYDGSTPIVSRQPRLWDVTAPTKLAGSHYLLPFGDIATPPFPGSFGPIPLAPVLAPIGPGRRLLVWFYLWHAAVNWPKSFWAILSADIPLITTYFGKGPIVK
jgi:hypothetical protein